MFIVKEDIVGMVISVYDSVDRLMYRGRVRAIALHQSQHYVLLVEVTEVRPHHDHQLSVGSLTINMIPNEWEVVKLDAPDEAHAKETQR